jgi:spermidine synthase
MATAQPPAPPVPARIRGLALLALCFFLSGATGLVYQTVWMRMLGLVFGHTVLATTTVLVAFMAGLALGSWLLARRAPRLGNLIAAYGWLEVGIGVYCALLSLLLSAAAAIYLSLARGLALSYGSFTLVQFTLVGLVLLVPTTLMGGTLPVLAQALTRDPGRLGRTIGLLYAINTFGAVAGVALAGYLMLPAIGNRWSLLVAAAANLAVGALAIGYARATGRAAAPGATPAPAAASAALTAEGRATVLALGVSGAISMVYEVAWTRALALVIGSSTYAFTAMLLAFLIGIAGGSALYSWIRGRRRATPGRFAVLQVGIALATVAATLLYERLPALFLRGFAQSDAPASIQLIQIVVCIAALLVGTLFIGATFPCAVSVAARGAGLVGEDVGRTYAVNTLGAIAGSALAGLVLIPVLGLHGSFRVAVIGNLLLAAALFLGPPRPVRRRRQVAAALATAMAVGAWFLPPWSQDVLSSGVAVYAQQYQQYGWEQFRTRAVPKRILYYRDGPTASVTVHHEGDNLFLRTNGKTDASTSYDIITQLMLGHLPMLTHPTARAVLVIGLGSGVTAGAITGYPLERLDVVEIEPAVVEAARFFGAFNANVLDNPNVHVSIADGRNYLLLAPRRYDVIVSEPSNPWIGGLASLFTVEMFQRARDRLQPGGVMVQWIQAYSLQAEDLKMVIRTFASVFPATTLWAGTPGDFLLVGSVEPRALDLRAVQERLAANPATRRLFGATPGWPDLLSFFLLGAEDTARLVGDARLNTDDRLPLEFSAPRSLYVNTVEGNRMLVTSAQRMALPPLSGESQALLATPAARTALGLALARQAMIRPALAQFDEALTLQASYGPALEGAAAASLRLNRYGRALELAERAAAADPQSPRAQYLLGVAAARLYDTARAGTAFERAAVLAPESVAIKELLVDYRMWEERGGQWRPKDDPMAMMLSLR